MTHTGGNRHRLFSISESGLCAAYERLIPSAVMGLLSVRVRILRRAIFLEINKNHSFIEGVFHNAGKFSWALYIGFENI